jgi:hypothetical protein
MSPQDIILGFMPVKVANQIVIFMPFCFRQVGYKRFPFLQATTNPLFNNGDKTK